MNNHTIGPNGRVNYVAGLAFCNTKIMLIRKNKPEWMKGKLNGIGGHIEAGETASEAMRREFTEETGLISPDNWKPFATLTGSYTNEPNRPWLIYWFVGIIPDIKPKGNPEEPVNWYQLETIHEEYLMPNLLWLIHMALERMSHTSMIRVYHVNEIY